MRAASWSRAALLLPLCLACVVEEPQQALFPPPPDLERQGTDSSVRPPPERNEENPFEIPTSENPERGPEDRREGQSGVDTFFGPDGVRLDVPQGAAPGVTFTISGPFDPTQRGPFTQVSGVYQIQPSTAFAVPARLTIPFDDSVLPAGASLDEVFIYRSVDNFNWQELVTEVGDGRAITDLAAASFFIVGLTTAGATCVATGDGCGEDRCCELCSESTLRCESCKPGGDSCAFDSDCCGGTCFDGTCFGNACVGTGFFCNATTLCCRGTCQFNNCTCTPPVAACTFDADCCEGTCDDGACSCVELNGSCANNTECCDDDVCVFGQCRVCAEATQVCDEDADCCEGTCVLNQCVPPPVLDAGPDSGP